MAAPHLEMRARRTAMLLHCQKVREQSRRRDLLRADHASRAAAAAEHAAREAEEAGKRANAERLRQAYDDFGGRVVDPGSLSTLPAMERMLARENEELETRTAAAAEQARTAREAADVARAALMAEARASEKRSKLADKSRLSWRRFLDGAEESERDDQVADTWRPA